MRLCTGEAAAGDELVRRHSPLLIRYLTRLSGSTMVAEELHQQTWLSVLDHIDRFQNSGPGSFRGWLLRIATNKMNDWWRSTGRKRTAIAGLKLVGDQEVQDVSETVSAAEQSEVVRSLIGRLPDNQQQVICMRYYANMKFVEIAAALGCPLNTALGRVHKAIGRLKQMMDDLKGAS